MDETAWLGTRSAAMIVVKGTSFKRGDGAAQVQARGQVR